jgi:hypothetical protein
MEILINKKNKPKRKPISLLMRISSGIVNHQKIYNRELPQQQSLTLGEELS